MDTTPQYSNILKAIQQPPIEDKLSPADKVENYDLFKKLNEQGIKLSDLIRKAEQNAPKQDDSELFSIMESAVKNEPDVKNARQHLADVKSQVLAKICYQHPEYKDAIDEYRRVVSETYKRVNTKSETEKVTEKPQVVQIG